MFKPQITVNQWLQLPWDIRLELAKIFNLKKSATSIVTSMGVQSDGHTPIDLAEITIEKLQDLTKSKSDDYFELLNKVVANITNANKQKTHEEENTNEESLPKRKPRGKVPKDSDESEN